MKQLKKEYKLGVVFLVIGLLIGIGISYDIKSEEDKHRFIVEKQEELKLKLIEEGRYRCCLEKPCTYCLEHIGEEVVCDCIDDIMEGKAPCGECLGEILEGNGNHLLSKEQLTDALSEELREREAVKKIIESKYS